MSNRIQVRRGTTAQWASAATVLAEGEPGLDTDLDLFKIGDGVTAWGALPVANSGTSVAIEHTQPTASTEVLLWERTPADAAHNAKISAAMLAYPNSGGGAGSDNVGLWQGFNARRVTNLGAATASEPALVFGIESNYFADGGDGLYGMEGYFDYISPDNSTVPFSSLRPWFFRILNSRTNSRSDKGIVHQVDVGAGSGANKGSWALYASAFAGTRLFYVDHDIAISDVPLRLGSLGAFVAGDKYVVADGSGNLHVSTLGPESSFIRKVRQTVTDKTSFAGTSAEQWGTEEVTLDDAVLPALTSVTVDVRASGYMANLSEPSDPTHVWVEISLDGGSTWSAAAHVVAFSEPGGTYDSLPLAIEHSVTGTVTGDVQGRVMASCTAGAATVADFKNGVLFMDVLVAA